jgi:hypothetical protein
MALYRELAPDNVVYEQKRYRYQPDFEPLFEHSVDRVLAALTCGFGAGEPAAAVDTLSHAVPARLNQPPLEVLATVTRAIHEGQALRLRYYSMKTGAVEREIVPHSLVDSGLRWHVRAYDRTRGGFRDLVLTRMEQLQVASTPAAASELPKADEQWCRKLKLDLLPHPAHPHPESIERDFGMRRGRLTVMLRAAVAGYVLRQWQVDCSADASLRGPEFRLRLADAQTALQGVESAVLTPGFAAAQGGGKS